jgi:hypothetical protein
MVEWGIRRGAGQDTSTGGGHWRLSKVDII